MVEDLMSALVPLQPTELATRLGCSTEAVALTRDADLIDLHIDTLIPPRLWGYDVLARHGRPLGGHFFGHLDLPRMVDAGLDGAMWSITTNPFRTAGSRLRTFHRNLASLEALVTRSDGRLAFARTAAEYRALKAKGVHAILLAIQGGNALEASSIGPGEVSDNRLTRVTLVHLTNAGFGATSSPFHLLRRDKGLSDSGRRFVTQLAEQRVFLDLAHVHPKTFWDAVEVHDPSLPFLVTHTGVCGVKPHWRNLDDDQIRATADSGGVVGVILSTHFLRRKGTPNDAGMVVDHMEHIVRVGGENAVAVGTDYDGAISPPADLRGGDCYPRLVQTMLDRGWSESLVRKALGENFLRSFEALRPGG